VVHLQQNLKNSKNLTVPCGQWGEPLPKPNISIMFASIGELNAIKKSGIPNNFFSNCAIKRGIHLIKKGKILKDLMKICLALNIHLDFALCKCE
jgi:hypothetical protein